ncbi:MAG: hypothetical protein J6S80_03140 [Alphaproteobacteria bacterium]|nr:hypothetical protein [Alphaproteobacteria bacterium]
MKKYLVFITLCVLLAKPALAKCTFACGDGTGNPISQTSNTVPQNTNCTYSGYIFAGWSYNNTTYQPGETISSCLLGTRAYTAVWEAESEPEPEEPDYAAMNTVTSRSYVWALSAKKQQRLSGSGGAITYGDTYAGSPGERSIVTSLPNNTSSTSLPTSGAVVSALNNKQSKIPANNNRVITYTGASGGTSSIGVYNSNNTYGSQSGTLAEVQHVNGALNSGFDAHITCAEYATPGDSTTECILWSINQLSGTYVPESGE